MMKADLRVEMGTHVLTLKSSRMLENLRISMKKRELDWLCETSGNEFIYTLSYDQIGAFFEGQKMEMATISYQDDGQWTMLSVNDFNMTFGETLTHVFENNKISMYVSMLATLRVGWNWFGATAALTDQRKIQHYEMTSEGLLIDFMIETRYFKPVCVDVVAVGELLDAPIRYAVKDIQSSKVSAEKYVNTLKVLVPERDLDMMRQKVSQFELVQKKLQFKFNIVLSEYPLSKETQAWTIDENVILENPLIGTSIDDKKVLSFASSLSNDGNLVFMPSVVAHDEFEKQRQWLLNNHGKIVLVDQGSENGRTEIRELFKSLIALGHQNVYLITDDQFKVIWTQSELPYVVYSHTMAHLELYPEIKTVIWSDTPRSLVPLGAQKMKKLPEIKQHMYLVFDLESQIKDEGFNPVMTDGVHFIVGNKQTKHLVKQVYPNAKKIHLTGLPSYSKLEKNNPMIQSSGIGLSVTTEMAELLRNVNSEIIFSTVKERDNLRQYHVILTDNYVVAKKASVLGVPVVYIDSALTAETVDHFYRLSGPVIRDIQTGWPILREVFSEAFDFKPYITHAQNNLNEFHDDNASQRISEIL
ncbi:hypothetical protein [Weissella tructae]